MPFKTFETIGKQKHRYFETGFAVYTEFGVLAEVENLKGWINLTNDKGWVISMKKVYASWAFTYRYAQSLIGKKIIYETGASSSFYEYFRAVYADEDFGSHFDVPHDAGDLAISELLKLRLRREVLVYRIQSMQKALEEEREKNQVITQKDNAEVQKAIKMLDKDWDDWIKNPVRAVMIMGQAINLDEYPMKIDINFAMRLGINTTKTKRIKINVLNRLEGTNKVFVELPDYGDTPCTIAVKQSNHHSTLNEWCVASVTNVLDDWYSIEQSKKYKNHKQKRKPIEFFLDAHDEMMDKWVDKAFDAL